MSFSSPWFLAFLLLVPLVLGLALWVDRRRAKYAVAFTNLATSPSPERSIRNPRSAPVMVSAVSTTEARTSSIENEPCSVRARSRIARSFPRLPPMPRGVASFSGAATCSSSRFNSAPSSANTS